MKVMVCLCLAAVVVVVVARPDEKYTDKYDNIDLDEILNNDQLRAAYLKCILDEGKCTPEGKELKSHIKEALEDGCAKCNDKHKDGVRKVNSFLINKKPEEWKPLVDKYDPDHKYSQKYEKELKEIQI